MTKKDLETKAMKAVIRIDKKVTDIKNVLHDLSMKLCHIIKYKKDYYFQLEGHFLLPPGMLVFVNLLSEFVSRCYSYSKQNYWKYCSTIK